MYEDFRLHECLQLSSFKNLLAILVYIKWYHIVVLIWIFLMLKMLSNASCAFEHLYVLFEKCLFKFFAQVLIICLFINELQDSLRSILNIFLIIYIILIILWAVFSLSCWLLKHKSIKFLCSLIYLFISFFVCAFGVISKKLLPNPKTCSLLLYF